MNLSNPLESVLATNDANALLALARVGRLNGRQVARVTASTSPGAVRDALLRLVSTGLVRAEQTSNATFYSVNEQHLLWPAIRLVLDARDRFEAQVTALHEESAPPGTSVLLYGSTARTRSTAASDVDLLVVFDAQCAVGARDAFTQRLTEAVELWTGNRAEVYDLTSAQLADLIAAGDPIVDSWRCDARVLAGAVPDLRSAAA